VTTLSLRIEG